VHPEILALVPDLPRWVEARAMLLAGAPVAAAGAGSLVWSDEAALCAVVGDAAPDAVLAAAATRDRTVLCALEREDLADAFGARGYVVERATLHTLPDPAALPDDDVVAPLPPDIDLAHLPAPLADEIRRATAVVYAAWVDGLPVAFAHAPWRTERWFDVAVDTLPGARQLGLATRTAAAMIRAERALGREPVWGAADSNLPSLRLAARLGFVADDALWVCSPA
jgi:hypothetical protein